MIKISKVEIKGLHKDAYQVYDFSDCQFLKGQNGAGKSTVLQAIQLGLLGYVPGTGKKISQIWKHHNGKKLQVILHLDDNGLPIVIDREWGISATTQQPTSQFTISPDGYDLQSIVESLELPIFNFDEFMRMTSNQLKDWFVKFLPPSYSEVNWDEELSDYREDIDRADPEFIQRILNNDTVASSRGLEKVRSINEVLKAELSAAKDALARNQHTIQSLIYYDDVDTSEDTDELQKQIKVAQTHLFAADKIKNREEQIRFAKEGLEEFKDKVPEPVTCDVRETPAFKLLEGQKADVKFNYDRAVTDASRHSEKKFAILGEIKSLQKIIDSGGICPFTHSGCDEVRSLIDTYKADVEVKKAEVDEIQATIHKLNEDSNFYANEIKEIEKKMDECIADSVHAMNDFIRYTRYMKQLADAESIPVEDEEHDKAYWEAEIDSLNGRLSKILANQRYNKLIDELTSEKSKLNIKIEFIKIWQKITGPNGLQTTISEASFRTFEEPINKYIAIMFADGESRFKFNLSTAANSFDICIERGNNLIPWSLLSSGERCLVTIALLSCIVDYSNSGLKLIMIDDLIDHLDDDNIVRFFEAVHEIQNIQFIFAGVKNIPDVPYVNVIEIE